jgi:putative ABC transport system permease protein
LGQRVQALVKSSVVPFTIVGLALNPMLPYPNGSPGAYVAPSMLARLEPGSKGRELLLGVRLADPERSAEFIRSATEGRPADQFSFVRDWHNLRTFVQFNNDINVVLLRVFSLLALLAVGLIVAYTTSALVLARFREIGLLKAIGFTPNQVATLFLVEHLTLGAIGALAGILLGLLIFPRLFASAFLRRAADVLSTELSSTADLGTLLLVLVPVVLWVELVVGCFTWLPARRGGQIATLQAIQVGAMDVGARHSRLGDLAAWLRFPTPVVLGIYDAFSRPARARFTIVSLALTAVLATMVLATDGTLRAFGTDPTLAGQLPGDTLVTRGALPHAETLRILHGQAGVDSVIPYLMLEAQPAGNASVPITIKAVADPEGIARFRVLEGRPVQEPGEALVAQGMLDYFGIHLGEEIQLRAGEHTMTVRAVGRYNTTENLGMAAALSLQTAQQQLGTALEPTHYAVTLAPGADRAAVQQALLRASDNRLGAVPWEASEELDRMQSTARALGIALLIIALMNLFNTSLLRVQERIRDVGILKAVGMTPGQVITSVVAGTTVQAVLAAGIGIPLGVALSFTVYAWVTGRGGGGLGVPVPVQWSGIVVLVLFAAILVAVISSLVPARRAAALQVAEVLRHE